MYPHRTAIPVIQNIYIINGPNLNLLGRREPDLYGTVSFETYFELLRDDFPALALHYFQTNHEGQILDELHRIGFDADAGIVLNAGALTHTSIALRDAVAAITAPVVEVHISDIFRREPFRWQSYLRDVCVAHYIGHGLDGYRMGVLFLQDR